MSLREGACIHTEEEGYQVNNCGCCTHICVRKRDFRKQYFRLFAVTQPTENHAHKSEFVTVLESWRRNSHHSA